MSGGVQRSQRPRAEASTGEDAAAAAARAGEGTAAAARAWEARAGPAGAGSECANLQREPRRHSPDVARRGHMRPASPPDLLLSLECRELEELEDELPLELLDEERLLLDPERDALELEMEITDAAGLSSRLSAAPWVAACADSQAMSALASALPGGGAVGPPRAPVATADLAAAETADKRPRPLPEATAAEAPPAPAWVPQGASEWPPPSTARPDEIGPSSESESSELPSGAGAGR